MLCSPISFAFPCRGIRNHINIHVGDRLDQTVDHLRKKIFFFNIRSIKILKKLHKALFQHVHKCRSQSPHIHGNKAVYIQLFCCSVCVSGFCPVLSLINIMSLCHANQRSVFNMADTSCYASIVAESISKTESGHTDMKKSILRLLLHQIVMYFYICFFSIIIICINYHKRLGQNILCRKNCLTCSPWLCSVSRLLKAVRKIFQ